MTPEQEARLPAYARMEIEGLIRHVERLIAALAARDGKIGETSIQVDPYASLGLVPPMYLPEGSTVRFTFGQRGCWIDVRRRHEGALKVMASSRLLVEPHSTNHITLEVVDR